MAAASFTGLTEPGTPERFAHVSHCGAGSRFFRNSDRDRPRGIPGAGFRWWT